MSRVPRVARRADRVLHGATDVSRQFTEAATAPSSDVADDAANLIIGHVGR